MADGTADVVIVVAHNREADGLDTDRIGTVETHPVPDARRMVESGEARWVDDPRNIDDGYVTPTKPADEAPAADSTPADEPVQPTKATNGKARRGTAPPADTEPVPDTTAESDPEPQGEDAGAPAPDADTK